MTTLAPPLGAPSATPPGTADAPDVSPPASAPATEPTPQGPIADSQALFPGAVGGPVAAPTAYTTATADAAREAAAVAAEPHQSLAGLWLQNTKSDFQFLANIDNAGFQPDLSYRLPQQDTPAWKALTAGIPEQAWPSFGNAISAQHAQYIRGQLLAEMHNDQLAAQHGTVARLAVGLTDPLALATLAIPGVGEGADVGRVAKFLIGGTQMAAENAAFQALFDQGKYSPSGHDVALAAVNGFLLHGAASGVGAALDRAGLSAKRALGVNEVADLMEQGRLAPEQIKPGVLAEIKAGGPEGFGPDSASAARTTTDVAPAVELSPETAPNAVPQSALPLGQGLMRGQLSPFRTFSTVLRGSVNAIVRSRLGRMVGETIGAQDGSAATVGASDYSQLLTHTYEARIGQIEEAYKPQWMQEQGVSSLLSRYDRDVQERWSTAIAQEVRGIDTGSKAANAAASKYADVFDDIRSEAQRAGVDGFEQLDTNRNYLPRAFDFGRIRELNRQIGDQGMTRFLSDSLANTIDEPEVRDAIAKGYLQRTKRLALGIDQQMMNGVRLSDVEYIRDMLRDTPDVDPGHVDGVIDMLKRDMQKRDMQKRGSDEGSLRHAKHRVQFDETHAIDVPELGRVRIADLFSQDAHALASRYARTMSGAIGLARVGIKSDSDFARSLRESLSSLGEAGVDRGEIETTRKYAEGAYKLILGRPLDNEGFGLAQQAVRTAKDYAFARSMGQGFFSIANNLIRPLSFGYAKHTMRYLPALKRMFSFRDANGELQDGLMRDIERYTGIGGDSVSMSVFNHYANEGRLGKALDKAGHAMRVAGRATSHLGGMTPGLVFGQRMMAVGILDRIVRSAFGEADIPASRLAMMGLDRPMLDRIADQLRQHAPGIEGNGQRIRGVNWSQWQDLGARDAMLTAINREARTLIHGEDMASTGLWMNKSWGRLAIQLRRFPMMAMQKQLARALHDRELSSVFDLMLTGTTGALSEYAQAHLRSAFMNPEDREKYLAENASFGRLIAAGLQRNPYSGMVPQFVDALSSAITGHPVFDARASGLSGGVFGIPSVSAGESAWSAITGPLHNGGMTQRSMRALIETLPLGNTLPLVWLTNAMASDLPKEQPREPDAHKGAWLQ